MIYEFLAPVLAGSTAAATLAHALVSNKKVKAFRAWQTWDRRRFLSEAYRNLLRTNRRETALSFCVAYLFLCTYVLAFLADEQFFGAVERAWILRDSFYVSLGCLLLFLVVKMRVAHTQPQFWNKE
jgi:hypothetical protein